MSADPSDGDLAGLLAVLETREHWPRVEAIQALGARGDLRAVPALCEILEDDAYECWHTKAAAIEALAALGARESAGAMTAALTDGRQDPDVRIAAAHALATLQIAEAHVALRRVAALERGNAVGAAARECLDALTRRAPG